MHKGYTTLLTLYFIYYFSCWHFVLYYVCAYLTYKEVSKVVEPTHICARPPGLFLSLSLYVFLYYFTHWHCVRDYRTSFSV